MDQATKERVQQALDDIKSAPTDAPISIRAYERKHGFTRGYLQRRLNNQVAKFARNGPAPILQPGEVQGIVQAQCFTKPKLRSFIRICVENGRYSRVVLNNFPSQSLVRRFVKLHNKELSQRRAQALSAARAIRSTIDVVASHYENLAAVINKYKFEPGQIWNLDETGMSAQGLRNAGRVLASKARPTNRQVADCRRNVSALVTVNAEGFALPPMFILPGKQLCVNSRNAGRVLASKARLEDFGGCGS